MSKVLHNQRLRKVLKQIEANPGDKLGIGKLAAIACYSEYHFHRIFRSFTGESVYAYRKRLLLERAVNHLLYTQKSITEIAFDAGYEHQTSFNKAFIKHFACAPSEVRQRGRARLDCYLPHCLNLTEEITMTPEIRTLAPIPILSLRKTGSYKQAAAEAWGGLMKFAYGNKLMHGETRMFGISHDDPRVTQSDKIRYDACISHDAGTMPEGDISAQEISAGKYAVFLHKGAYENFPQTYAAIFNQWLPESGYQLRDDPCFEEYFNRDPRKTKAENLTTEIFIPLQ